MTGRLLAAGCVWRDYLAALPPTLTDREPRPGDDALRFVTGRRPVVEYAVAVAAEEQPGHAAGLGFPETMQARLAENR